MKLHATVTEAAAASFRYAWALKSAPDGGAAALGDGGAAAPDFTPAVDGDYLLELTVSDENGASTTKQLRLHATTPAAKIAPLPRGIAVGQTVNVHASLAVSTPSVGCTWAVSGVPVTASELHARSLRLVATAAGTATITLTITDNHGGHASTTSVDAQIH